jgi:hypothetical protein
MNSVCISTVCSADHFAYYIPTFVYSIGKAYPECDVKIFLRGKLPQGVRDCLEIIDETYKNYKIYENHFLECPNRESTCNTLRHLVSAKYYKDYKYVFITDIDFIFVRQRLPFYTYFANRIRKTKQPYASFRGPLRQPLRPEIHKDFWTGNFTRIADGTLMLKNPAWFRKTRLARRYYLKKVRRGGHDKLDKHRSCSYREYNEVMLYRICRMAGVKTPWRHDRFVDGRRFNYSYRQIHLGDFKFKDRFPFKRKMRRYLTRGNFEKFLELEQDETWQRICSIVFENCPRMKKILKRTRKYGKAVLNR